MTTEWTDAVESAELLDKNQLKLEVDLRAVCSTELGAVFDGLNANCPFCGEVKQHFSIYGDGLTKVGCWVCRWDGDVFDVIQAARDCTFKEALRVVQGYHTDGVTIDPDEVSYRSGISVSPKTWQSVIDAARENAERDDGPIVRFLTRKGLKIPATWLREQFWIGTRGGTDTILIPHVDRYGSPLGYKERRWDTVPISAKGSRFTDLYGSWRDQGRGRVLICEGESDTWTVAYLLRNDEWDVFGLPTGAGTPPREHLIDMLDGRQVVLAFDADPAGRQGIERWNAAMREPSVLRLPDGQDCSSLEARVLRRLIEEAL